MAPGAIQTNTTPASNGTGLKATARAFHPTGTPDPARYHASSSEEAVSAEAKYAAHNYHPLPIGMQYKPLCSRSFADAIQSSLEPVVVLCGTLKASTTWTSSLPTAP